MKLSLLAKLFTPAHLRIIESLSTHTLYYIPSKNIDTQRRKRVISYVTQMTKEYTPSFADTCMFFSHCVCSINDLSLRIWQPQCAIETVAGHHTTAGVFCQMQPAPKHSGSAEIRMAYQIGPVPLTWKVCLGQNYEYRNVRACALVNGKGNIPPPLQQH